MANLAGQNIQADQPPGTLLLDDLQSRDLVSLHPVPSDDPDDPLNWSTRRKTINMSFVLVYVMLTFTQLDIGPVAFAQYQDQLGFTVADLNTGQALGFAGLGCGSILFIPLVNKYGRRPVYLASLALQMAACLWLSLTKTTTDLWLANTLAGIGGAVCETIVQITISDIFFVHQHAQMNAYYLLFTTIGASLGPVAAGYIVHGQGWRWMWRWCVILIGANLIFAMFFFEESKFLRVLNQERVSSLCAADSGKPTSIGVENVNGQDQETLEHGHPNRRFNSGIQKKPYRECMALLTTTEGPIFRNIHNPFVVLVTLPAVTFAAITFGGLLALFAVLVSIQATYLPLPPYSFTASQVGLMNLSGFIASIPAVFVGGWLDDWLIISLSERNGGVYEPEMRLWPALPCALMTPASMLMVGLGLAKGMAWPIIAVGFGLFSFCLAVSGTIALSYAMDCYLEIIGTAMVGIIFTRNALAVGVLFAITPWVTVMGLANVHIILAVGICLVQLLPFAFLWRGKIARAATAARYQKHAEQQATQHRS